MSFLFLLFLHAPASAFFQNLGNVNSPSTFCRKMMKCRAAKVMKLHWRDWANLAKMVLNQIEQNRIINTLINIHSFIYFALFQLVQELMDSTRLQEVQERVDERRGSCWGRRWRRGTSCRRWRRGRRRCRRGMTRRRRSSSCWSRRNNKREIKSWVIWQDAGLQLSHSHFSWRIEKGRIQFWSKKIEQLSCQREDVDRWTIS